MANFQDLFINMAFIGLIVFSLFAFTIIVQEDNDAPQKIVDNSLINNTYTGLRTDLEGFQESSQAQKLLFEREQPTLGFGTLLFYSVISAGKVFNGMIGVIFNSVIKLPVVILGLDPVLVSVITTILVLVIIVGLWIIYKVGG
jgi:hypothetical protein